MLFAEMIKLHSTNPTNLFNLFVLRVLFHPEITNVIPKVPSSQKQFSQREEKVKLLNKGKKERNVSNQILVD